MSFVVF